MRLEAKGSRQFVAGAAILSAAGILSRVMGLGYRVVLIRLIGAEGMGLYQMAYPLYTIMLVVSRSGIPVTLAKMISERIAREEKKDAYRIFTIARILSVVIGLLAALTMALIARPVISLLQLDPRAYYALLAISPAILVVSIMASFRGFFQGLQDMKPTALSQLIEQFVRMITMISLAYLLLPLGLSYAAAGASFGAFTGAIAGLLLVIYIYYKRRENIFAFLAEDRAVSSLKVRPVLQEFFGLGVPITLGALVMPLMSFVDWVFVPQRLQAAGFVMERATTLYGQFTTVAMPLVHFPTIITVSLATSLVPAISEAFAVRDETLIQERTSTALRLTVMLGIPAAIGLFVLAEPLTGVIFAEPQAASILQISALGVIFITLQQTSSAILQGIGRTDLPAKNLFLGAICNAVINFTLTGIPAFNIHGAALGTVTGFAVAAALNIIYVKKLTGTLVASPARVGYPALSALVMGFTVYFFHSLMLSLSANIFRFSGLISLTAAVGLGVLLYGFLLIYSGEIGAQELKLIPGVGVRISGKLQDWGVL